MSPDEFIGQFGVQGFWHFTDTRNLPSIRGAGGILSLSELQREGIDVPAPGGNDWSHKADTVRGLDKYVHLCLFGEHPMEFRAREDGRLIETRFLPIDPAVLAFEGVAFSPDVSNKVGTPRLNLAEACEQMDFEVVYKRTDWRDPEIKERLVIAKRYELLVPGRIPLQYIGGL